MAHYYHLSNRPQKLEPHHVEGAHRQAVTELKAAEAAQDAKAFLKALRRWNDWEAYLSGEYARVGYELAKNTAHEPTVLAEKYFREKIIPVSSKAGFEIGSLLLASKLRSELISEMGEYFFKKADVQLMTSDPKNVDLRVLEGGIVKEYEQFVARAEVTVQGQKMTLTKARSLGTSENADLRRDSFFAYRKWFVDHHAELSGFFARLVENRQKQAENLGHSNYLKLGYAGMSRTDYGQAESKQFRSNVERLIVPLVKKLREAQAKELGTPLVHAWDASFTPSLRFPDDAAPVATQLDCADQIFGRLSPVLQGHFRKMRQENLIDLENRPGKRAGAFCTSFPDEKRVAIFCNSTGSHSDVGTLMHEMGHAFQAWESQGIEWVEMRWPTLDAAEIHSMGMEYLSLRHMDVFFKGDLKNKFKKEKFKDALELLCHIAVVDEFQHWVYENPKVSPSDRDDAWCRIFDRFQPGWDFSQFPEAKWARWYAQSHIYAAPFYYIDYGIAEMGAMQLAMLEERDATQALSSYLALCRLGGQKSVLDIFKSAGLESPFQESLVQKLADYAQNAIRA
ncbi:MAG: M3 family oligoendopeptidase [Bdellovibrionales bacterium]|nr:M3 family oligoendopeptidase [Bdellovibrionales bacterium]